MAFEIETEVDVDFDFDYKELFERTVNACLDEEECPYEASVNLLITDNESIREINKETRKVDKETDVLSFPMYEYDVPGNFDELTENVDIFNPESGELMLGDIVLSIDRIKSQAEEFGHSVKREYAFLIVHSMLHLVGYDHMEEDERIVMEEKQRVIMDILGILR